MPSQMWDLLGLLEDTLLEAVPSDGVRPLELLLAQEG